MSSDRMPRSVLIYGVLGLIPFMLTPAAALVRPELTSMAGRIEALYGALILSFLGGVRWAFAVQTPRTSPVLVSLSMIPTIAALAIVTLLDHSTRLQLITLALALLAHWGWDLRAADAPAWFPRMRTILTAGAVTGLLAGAWALG